MVADASNEELEEEVVRQMQEHIDPNGEASFATLRAFMGDEWVAEQIRRHRDHLEERIQAR